MRELQKITLRELLPPSIAGDPDIMAMAESIDAELRKTTNSIPNIAIIARIHRAYDEIQANPAISDEEIAKIITPELVDLKAWEWHVDFYEPDAPLKTRVKLVAKSLDWHTRKGTPSVVEEVVTAVFADALVAEWFEYGGRPYTFKVLTEITNVPGATIANLITAIFSVKNTRSWLQAIEILRRGEHKVYHAAAVVQEETVEIEARLGVPKLDDTVHRYASFVTQISEIELHECTRINFGRHIVYHGAAVAQNNTMKINAGFAPVTAGRAGYEYQSFVGILSHMEIQS